MCLYLPTAPEKSPNADKNAPIIEKMSSSYVYNVERQKIVSTIIVKHQKFWVQVLNSVFI